MTQWKDIPGWEGFYQASEDGQIRSVDRVYNLNNQWGAYTRVRKGKLLTPYLRPDGYLSVSLRRNDKMYTSLIHRLVAITFIGEPKLNQEVCHNNGNRTDNRLNNLRWDTRSNNHRDKRKHGTNTAGERNPQSKLTWDTVTLIRASKDSQRALAERFGVCQQLVSLVKRNKIWQES